MRGAAAILLLMAAGCSRTPPPAVNADSRPAEHLADRVRLTLEAQKQAGVAVEEVASRSLPETLRATARISQDETRTWRVGAITEGRVVSVYANPGDRVAAGQVLARLHSHDIHEARAEYRRAVTELARARAVESHARRVRERAKRLFELKAGSLEQFEQAETELRTAQTAVTSGQVEVERTRNHLEEFLGIAAEDRDQGKGHDEEDYIPARTPAAGIVLSRNVTPGTVVTPANDLFTVTDFSHVWALAEVSEEYLPRLRSGMPVRVFVQAYGGQAFPGRIGKIGEALDPATRTVKVRVDLANPGGRLKPEMYATVEIELGGTQPALFVPQEALQEVRGQTVTFVRLAEDSFAIRPVEPGHAVNGLVEIRRGLKPGERVATRSTFILKSEFLKASLAEE